VDECQVKAAYVYNFAKFVDWPPQTFESAAQPLVFCVLGQSAVSDPLRAALEGRVVDQRPLVFRLLTDVKEARKCHVLFVSPGDKKSLRQTLDGVRSLPILTAGETDDFTNQGGMVRFVLEGGRVRLEFNLDAAESAKLRISSKLLSLAKTVRRGGK
jgi:hypothetical protein